MNIFYEWTYTYISPLLCSFQLDEMKKKRIMG